MNIVKKIYTKSVHAVLDFGFESVVVLIAEKKEGGDFQIIGAGDSAAQGVKGGEVVHPGDATESIIEALKKAERSSGTKVERLYYNFDDAQMQSVISRGSKFLSGEGEIQSSDVKEARKIAERLVGHFEKTMVYSQPIQFMIDDRDTVLDPVGVFGKKLDVFVRVLQARSSHCEAWQRLMSRCQISKSTAVPSAWSTAYGLLDKEDHTRKKLIFDVGKDFLNVFTFANHQIVDYKVFLTSGADFSDNGDGLAGLAKEFLSLNIDVHEILVTGDLAQEPLILESLGASTGIPSRLAAPQGIAKLHYPKYASVVGLLSVADEIESKMPMLRAEKSLFLNVKEKAVSFINEYF